jgi:hypothetical protein
MSVELEAKLKMALQTLEKASQDFKLKQASFVEVATVDALKELVREQLRNEDTVHTAGQVR